MVPKIHAKGKSFKGAAAYLLHDKNRARSSHRVAWSETRNLATDNPHVAWKVMAATAIDQDRLKAEAGVKKTGRKSVDSVLHFSLSWHKEEKDGLTREEMVRSALGALRALGAESRQALIICHSDEPQPHIHVLVNRVSPDDGRMLSSSNEKLELSKWAEGYEKERGRIYCEDRVINNAARKRDEYTRGIKDKARNILEAQAANDNTPSAEAIRNEQRRKEADYARKVREQREKQRKAWAALERIHKERQAEIREQCRQQTLTEKTVIRERHRPEWTELFHEHQAGMQSFLQKEKSLLGRVHNALKAIDFKAILRGEILDAEGRTRRQVLGEAFDALSSAGARLEALKRQQEMQKRELESRQKQAEAEAARRIHAERDQTLEKIRISFEQQRGDLILTQQMEGAKLRAERLTITRQREKTREELRQIPGHEIHLPENIPDRDRIARKLAEWRERARGRDRGGRER